MDLKDRNPVNPKHAKCIAIVLADPATNTNAATGPWKGSAVRDGNLITGQQSQSGRETAEVLAAALGY